MKSLQDIITSPRMQSPRTSRYITRLFGWLAQRKFPKPVLRFLIEKYISAFDVEMEHFDFDLQKAGTFQEFFLRPFKEGKRSFQGSIASPAEGFLTASGKLETGELLQVKGSNYKLSTLLAEPGFEEGSFLTIYLGLGDYHHVHMPFDARIQSVKTVPGNFFATNQKALRQKEQVYCQNERVIIRGDSETGRYILVLVGATCVGKIKTTFQSTKEEISPVSLKQGYALAAFEMGSTVILILDNQKLAHLNSKPGDRILLGEKIAD